MGPASLHCTTLSCNHLTPTVPCMLIQAQEALQAQVAAEVAWVTARYKLLQEAMREEINLVGGDQWDSLRM